MTTNAATSRTRLLPILALGLLALLFTGHSPARDLPEKISIDCCSQDTLGLYLHLAEYSSLAYRVPEEEMLVAEHGCAALVRMDSNDNLIVAFRGSVSPFIDRATLPTRYLVDLLRLRRYQDWIETNILQSFGHLPEQYVEAAELIVEQIQKHPHAKGIFITGHSKGGGVAEAAAAVAWLDPDIPPETKRRIVTVTFNAAVVHTNNWRVLYKATEPALLKPYLKGDTPRVDAVIMRDDFVPKVRWRHRRLKPFVNLVVIEPSERIWPADQHSIAVVIAELEKRLGIHRPSPDEPKHSGISIIHSDPVPRKQKGRRAR